MVTFEEEQGFSEDSQGSSKRWLGKKVCEKSHTMDELCNFQRAVCMRGAEM